MDYFAKRYGIGGRLFTVIFTLIFSFLPILGFCFFLERNLWVTVVTLYFNGFCVAFPRTGSLTYTIEKCPLNAAGVSCSFSSSREILAFLSVPLSAYVYDNFDLLYYGFSAVFVILIFCIAIVRVTYYDLISFELIHPNGQDGEKMENDERDNGEKEKLPKEICQENEIELQNITVSSSPSSITDKSLQNTSKTL